MATATTINKTWTVTNTSNNKYAYRILDNNDTLTSTTKTHKLVTPAIDSTSKLSGNKVLIIVHVTAGGDNVAADCFLEISADGTNFSQHEGTGQDYLEVSSDIQPDATGQKVFMVDLTSYAVPYYRIGINSAGLDLGTALKVKLGYAYPIT